MVIIGAVVLSIVLCAIYVDVYVQPTAVEKLTEVYYFDEYSMDRQWESRAEYMTNGELDLFAKTNETNDVQRLTGNTCSGEILGVITKVEIRGYGRDSDISGDHDVTVVFYPIFTGRRRGAGEHWDFSYAKEGSWSDWFDITNDSKAPSTWTWETVEELNVDVKLSETFGTVKAYVSKVEIRVTYI